MPLESTLSQSIMKAIREKIPGTVVRKRHVTMGAIGDPDLYGCLPGGQHFEIEVKRPGNKPTALQLRRLEEWNAAGAIAGYAHSVAEALAIVFGGMFSRSQKERNT